MKALKYAFGAIVALALIAVIVGFVLPAEVKVDRTVTMQVSPSDIHPLVNDLKMWNEWSAWNTKQYPEMKVEYGTTFAGVGGEMSWEGPEVGKGRMEITKSDASGIEYKVFFEEAPEPMIGSIKLAPEGTGTKVEWSSVGQVDFMGRYFRGFIESAIGDAYDEAIHI